MTEIREVCVERGIVESAGEAAGKPLWKARVARADKVNRNNRLYPAAILKGEVRRLQSVLASGGLVGSIDHPSYMSAGSLSTAALIWRSLEFVEADKSVMGHFEVVPIEPHGTNLLRQIKAGMQVGFSTYGMGSSHAATTVDRRKYGVEGSFEVMDSFELSKIDAVDQPSVIDAHLIREAAERRTAAEKVAAELLQCCVHQEDLLPETVHRLEQGEAPDRVLEWSKEADESLARRARIRAYGRAA